MKQPLGKALNTSFCLSAKAAETPEEMILKTQALFKGILEHVYMFWIKQSLYLYSGLATSFC